MASPIEIVTVKVRGIGAVDKLTTPPERAGGTEVAEVGRGSCVFRVEDALKSFDTPYFDRFALPQGTTLSGPAILLQTDSTTVVPPGWSFASDRFGNVLMTRNDD